MSYPNPVMIDVLVRERHQALLQEARMHRLVREAQASQNRPKINLLAALRKRIATRIRWPRPRIEASFRT